MPDCYVGEIRLVAFNYAPEGWAFCNGQILPISQNQALFSLLGTTYGGNGTSTFALPNLQGRVVVHAGQGLGLSPYQLGQTGGVENVTLTTNNMPAHTHGFAISANNTVGETNDPTNAYPGLGNDSAGGAASVYTKTMGNVNMAQQNTGVAGGNLPVSVVQPYIALNYIIALTGIYPPRS